MGAAVWCEGYDFAELSARFGNHPTGLAAVTTNWYAIALGLVWRYAERRLGFEGKNVWQGQMRPATKHRGNSGTGKRAFTASEVAKLLERRPEVAPAKDVPATLPWLALIGAYSGMRLNEVCELEVDDVKETAGIFYFDLPKAKTGAGVRVVPIHSKILEGGLLEYRKAVGKGSLWPALRPGGPDKKRSMYVSKRFTDYRRALGLIEIDKITGRDRLEFHSLRRSAITALKHAGIPDTRLPKLLGTSTSALPLAYIRTARSSAD